MRPDSPSQPLDAGHPPDTQPDPPSPERSPAPSEHADEGSTLAAGSTVGGRYQVLAKLGSGGMGVVYRARHLTLGHEVAIKVVRDPQSNALQSRFLREAQLASRVQHPHTVYVIDVGQLPDGQLFLAMELLQGRTLRAALAAGGPMGPLRVCRIGAMIASGMQSVHLAGIVHRDLKPSNIFLLDKEGTQDLVKIVDFGVAKEVRPGGLLDGTVTGTSTPAGESVAALTHHGARIGTLRYMAPEQLRGEPIDERADQYALGCILYELLTGELPFGAAADASALAPLYGELLPPRQRQPAAGISEKLDAIIVRLLARRRDARFPDMRALAASLHAEAERLGSRRDGALARSPRRVLLGVLAAMVLSTGGLRMMPRHEQAALPEALQRAKLPDSALPQPRASGESEATIPLAATAQVAPARASAPHAQSPAPRTGAEPLTALMARANAALQRNDRFLAQQLLVSARQRCRKNADKTLGCAATVVPLAFALGRIHEAEGHWADALSEYNQVLDAAPTTSSQAAQLSLRSEAAAAVARLIPRLGRIIITRPSGGRCAEVSMFLTPGEHRIELAGHSQLVTIQARQTQRLGSCPSQ